MFLLLLLETIDLLISKPVWLWGWFSYMAHANSPRSRKPQRCSAPLQQSGQFNTANQKQTEWTDWERPVWVRPNLHGHPPSVRWDATGEWRQESMKVIWATMNNGKLRKVLRPGLKWGKEHSPWPPQRGEKCDINLLWPTAFKHTFQKKASSANCAI